ncbi:MAG: hypothetical protein KKF62_12650 [Bacteroidetes bacterium]|nr:hypothetical protein [Bacteroidota bacterium]MBU1114891.1 hypothetical protein [Bacteroidota bacterium]MBU1798030.1 hypothetical protein [Bacteroidota bacterium]
MNDIKKKCNEKILQIDNWLYYNGIEGWDPYDVWDGKLGSWMLGRKSFSAKLLGFIVTKLELMYPLIIRKVFFLKQKINPKGIGLFANSYKLLENLGDNFDLSLKNTSMPFYLWLNENAINEFGGMGWGYPFNWNTKAYIPKLTPTVVNTVIIGDAFWLEYKTNNDDSALNICKNICKFIETGLNKTKDNSGNICFSYTPLDQMQVHNANLMAADFLIRIGTEIENIRWIELAKSAVNFSISQIKNDGTLNYWSDTQSGSYLQQDTYHSGFEIRSLISINKILRNDEIKLVIEKYFDTWLKDFFSANWQPAFQRSDFSIIEVHSCAEAILCLIKAFEINLIDLAKLKEITNAILDCAIDKLWVTDNNKSGYFAWEAYKKSKKWIKVDIPLIRWGQGWMLYALVELINILEHTERYMFNRSNK